MAEQIYSPPNMGRSIITHDPRSRAFPAMGFLATADVPLRNRVWRRGAAYDQGQTSSCVGQTSKGLLNTQLFSHNVAYKVRSKYDALSIYANAQKFDQWPGEDYDGTSALGAAEYLRSVGIISEYRWCFGLQDVLDTLAQHGPVGIGIWWHEDMWDTDEEGFIHATGDQVGGHEVEINGLNVKGKYVVGTNSWGSSWGVKGRFKLSWDDLGKLLDDDGDAVTFVK